MVSGAIVVAKGFHLEHSWYQSPGVDLANIAASDKMTTL